MRLLHDYVLVGRFAEYIDSGISVRSWYGVYKKTPPERIVKYVVIDVGPGANRNGTFLKPHVAVGDEVEVSGGAFVWRDGNQFIFSDIDIIAVNEGTE